MGDSSCPGIRMKEQDGRGRGGSNELQFPSLLPRVATAVSVQFDELKATPRKMLGSDGAFSF